MFHVYHDDPQWLQFFEQLKFQDFFITYCVFILKYHKHFFAIIFTLKHIALITAIYKLLDTYKNIWLNRL